MQRRSRCRVRGARSRKAEAHPEATPALEQSQTALTFHPAQGGLRLSKNAAIPSRASSVSH